MKNLLIPSIFLYSSTSPPGLAKTALSLSLFLSLFHYLSCSTCLFSAHETHQVAYLPAKVSGVHRRLCPPLSLSLSLSLLLKLCCTVPLCIEVVLVRSLASPARFLRVCISNSKRRPRRLNFVFRVLRRVRIGNVIKINSLGFSSIKYKMI